MILEMKIMFLQYICVKSKGPPVIPDGVTDMKPVSADMKCCMTSIIMLISNSERFKPPAW